MSAIQLAPPILELPGVNLSEVKGLAQDPVNSEATLGRVLERFDREVATFRRQMRVDLAHSLLLAANAGAAGAPFNVQPALDKLRADAEEHRTGMRALHKVMARVAQALRKAKDRHAHRWLAAGNHFREVSDKLLEEHGAWRDLLEAMHDNDPTKVMAYPIVRATAYYCGVLTERFGLAQPPEHSAQVIEDEVLSTITVPVAPELLQDTDRLLEIEGRTHEQIRAIEPALVGRVAIRYVPAGDVA